MTFGSETTGGTTSVAASAHSFVGKGADYLSYPRTIGGSLQHWVEFEAFWATGPQKNSLDVSIALYMPADSLTTSYKSEYEASSLGIPAGKGLDIINQLAGSDEDPQEAIKKTAASQSKAAKSEMLQVAGIMGAGMKSEKLKTIMERKLGAVVNPYIIAAYKGPGTLREHTFSFKMMPENAAESENCMNIVQAFKKAMLPHHKGGDNATSPSMLFGYPDEFLISYVVGGKRLPRSESNPMFNIGKSVCTGCDLNFATQDVPLFFEGTQFPVTIDMKLNFMELDIMHRHRVEKGY